jgi:hypothetical protein
MEYFGTKMLLLRTVNSFRFKGFSIVSKERLHDSDKACGRHRKTLATETPIRVSIDMSPQNDDSKAMTLGVSKIDINGPLTQVFSCERERFSIRLQTKRF